MRELTNEQQTALFAAKDQSNLYINSEESSVAFETGFIAGLECQQAALVAALRDLVEYCDRRLFWAVHITQEPPEMQAARAVLAGVASEGGAT